MPGIYTFLIPDQLVVFSLQKYKSRFYSKKSFWVSIKFSPLRSNNFPDTPKSFGQKDFVAFIPMFPFRFCSKSRFLSSKSNEKRDTVQTKSKTFIDIL